FIDADLAFLSEPLALPSSLGPPLETVGTRCSFEHEDKSVALPGQSFQDVVRDEKKSSPDAGPASRARDGNAFLRNRIHRLLKGCLPFEAWIFQAQRLKKIAIPVFGRCDLNHHSAPVPGHVPTPAAKRQSNGRQSSAARPPGQDVAPRCTVWGGPVCCSALFGPACPQFDSRSFFSSDSNTRQENDPPPPSITSRARLRNTKPSAEGACLQQSRMLNG